MIFQRCFNALFCNSNEQVWCHANEELLDFTTPMYKRETGAVIDILWTVYRPHLFLCALDELFHMGKQLKYNNFDANCTATWGILLIVQHHCTKQCGGGKPKGHALGDAFPHIDFRDVAEVE